MNTPKNHKKNRVGWRFDISCLNFIVYSIYKFLDIHYAKNKNNNKSSHMLFSRAILKDVVQSTVYTIFVHNTPVCLGERLGETAYRQLQLLRHTGHQKHRSGQ